MRNTLATICVSLLAVVAYSSNSAWAQAAADYSGRYVAKVSMLRDSCLDASVPVVTKRDIVVTQAGKQISGTEDTKTQVLNWSGRPVKGGFNLRHAEVYSDPIRGECTYADTIVYRNVTTNKASPVTYTYTEKCTDNGAVIWQCKTTWQGKAKRIIKR
jgi:hypothetical protein